MLPGAVLPWEPPEKTPPVLLLEFILGCTGKVEQPLGVTNTQSGRYNLCTRHSYADIHFSLIPNLTSFSFKQHHSGQYFDEIPCWKEPRNSLTLAVLWGMTRRTDTEMLLDSTPKWSHYQRTHFHHWSRRLNSFLYHLKPYNPLWIWPNSNLVIAFSRSRVGLNQ